jgi:hypothetical protein
MAESSTRLIAMLCLLITGCGSLPAQSGTASSSRASTPHAASGAREASPCPAAQLPSSFPTSPASSRNLVIAKLSGSNQTIIRDVTDINHASTVATVNEPDWVSVGAVGSPSFVSSSTISYSSFQPLGLVRMPLAGAGTSLLAIECPTQDIWTFKWSPDGQSLTYILADGDPNSLFRWHLVSGGVDREIGTAPRECICGEIPEDNRASLSFSPDGQFVSLVESVRMGTDLQVRRLDGSLVGSEIRGDGSASPVTMGVWSGTSLFFRDKQGVERWTDGDIKPFLPGVAWLHPWASPTGGQIVYAVRGSDGLARVNVVDTASGQTRELSSQPRNWPHFLTSRYVWYTGDRLCGPNDGPCPGATTTGTTYIYDLQSGTESQSIITDIADVWPHAA